MNPLFFPVVALAALLFYIGNKVGARPATMRARLLWGIAATLCAVPAVLFATYYLHWFDDAVWFYRFRSVSWTELTAAGAGLLAGLLYGWLAVIGRSWRIAVPALLLAGLFVPYMKAVVAPLDVAGLAEGCSDRDGVCLQSTASTCGPASVASLLKLFNMEESERALAQEAYTTSGGTENWYLARTLRRRGFPVDYVIMDRPVTQLLYPSVAGVRLTGGAGHYISILGETGDSYVIGDPMVGRKSVPKARLREAYDFTGFFMVVGARSGS